MATGTPESDRTTLETDRAIEDLLHRVTKVLEVLPADHSLHASLDEIMTASKQLNITLQEIINERKQIETAAYEQQVLAEALQDTAITLNRTLDLSQVLERILANVGRVVPHDAAEIMLIESGVARVVRSRGYVERGLEETIMALRLSVADTSTLRQMVETGQPVIIPDTYAQSGWIKILGGEWIRSYIGVPIRVQEETIGFLNLNSTTSGFFNPQFADRLKAFAEQAAVAIHNAQLHEQAQEAAALEERQRLARELHDAVSQSLFSSSIITEGLLRLKHTYPDEIASHLETLYRLNRGALAEMRALLLELRPNQLLNVDLAKALRQLTQSLESRRHIEVDLTIDDSDPVPPDVQIALYRIAQEALNNIVKHSRATRVAVHYASTPEKAELHIRDDGRGFNLEQIKFGIGLESIRERAESIGASLQIDSQLGKGTRISVALAWDQQENTA